MEPFFNIEPYDEYWEGGEGINQMSNAMWAFHGIVAISLATISIIGIIFDRPEITLTTVIALSGYVIWRKHKQQD